MNAPESGAEIDPLLICQVGLVPVATLDERVEDHLVWGQVRPGPSCTGCQGGSDLLDAPVA